MSQRGFFSLCTALSTYKFTVPMYPMCARFCQLAGLFFFCVWSRGCVWFGLLGIGLVLVYVGRTARIRKRLLCCTLILSSAQELANRSLQSCPSDWSSAQTRNFRLVPWESGRGGFNGNINVLSQSVRLLSQFRCLRVLPAGNDLFSIEMG